MINAKEQYEFFLDAINSYGTFLLQRPKGHTETEIPVKAIGLLQEAKYLHTP